MPFLFEKNSTRQWSCLQAEHDILEAHPVFAGYLDHRVADKDRKIVVYYVKGIGMGPKGGSGGGAVLGFGTPGRQCGQPGQPYRALFAKVVRRLSVSVSLRTIHC
jgi:hypothetical protein